MAVVDGHTVQVGDYVCFKSDVEQMGKVVAINGRLITLFRDNEGFDGDYIGGENYTVQHEKDCWIE